MEKYGKNIFNIRNSSKPWHTRDLPMTNPCFIGVNPWLFNHTPCLLWEPRVWSTRDEPVTDPWFTRDYPWFFHGFGGFESIQNSYLLFTFFWLFWSRFGVPEAVQFESDAPFRNYRVFFGTATIKWGQKKMKPSPAAENIIPFWECSSVHGLIW